MVANKSSKNIITKVFKQIFERAGNNKGFYKPGMYYNSAPYHTPATSPSFGTMAFPAHNMTIPDRLCEWLQVQIPS